MDYDDEHKSQMPKKEILNIINDIFLTNYWCTRKNMINISSDYIVNLNEIRKWKRFFDNIDFEEVNNINNDYSRSSNKSSRNDVGSFLKIQAKPIYDILNIGNGKISLCGGAIVSILNGGNPNDYDIFFHSDSVEEADDIFNECLKYLDELNHEKYINTISYSRSKYLMKATVCVDNFYATIQFIKRIYKTKEQVLFSFDLAPSRLGYNPKDGIFSTICGAMALSMNAFALDISTRSKSFGSRLEKYNSDKNYKILLPQLENNLKEDEVFEIFDNINLIKCSSNRFAIRSYDQDNGDYVSDRNNLDLLIKKDYDNVSFSSESLQIITELPNDFIEQQMMMIGGGLSIKPSTDDNIGKKDAKDFLDDKYKEFVLAYFVDENDIKADAIWKEKIKYYIDTAKECAKNIKDNLDKNYYKGWKYLNSGSKYFGQNYPVNNPPY
jgi:hypothetical protein